MKSRSPAVHRSSILLTLLTSLLCVFVSSGEVGGPYNLRGKIILQSGHESFSAEETAVALLDQQTGQMLASTYTGPDGIFYLKGIPVGSYILTVRVINFVGKYPITVAPNWSKANPNGGFLDLAPITVAVH